MIQEIVQPERRQWTSSNILKYKEIPNGAFRQAVDLLSTKEWGISVNETDRALEIYSSSLVGARVLNRIKNSYEMKALETASSTGDAKNIPNFDFCDWDGETIRRIKGWRLTRLIEAYKGHVAYWETSAANYEQRKKTEKISLVEEDRMRWNMSKLKDLKTTLSSMEVELPQVMQDLTPFEDRDLHVLVEEIVERELGVEPILLHQ